MRNYQSLSRVKWECKYHIVWVKAGEPLLVDGSEGISVNASGLDGTVRKVVEEI